MNYQTVEIFFTKDFLNFDHCYIFNFNVFSINENLHIKYKRKVISECVSSSLDLLCWQRLFFPPVPEDVQMERNRWGEVFVDQNPSSLIDPLIVRYLKITQCTYAKLSKDELKLFNSLGRRWHEEDFLTLNKTLSNFKVEDNSN